MYTLSSREAQVLAYAELSPDLPLHRLAHLSKVRQHSAAYIMRRLTERGIVKRAAFIDAYALGFQDVAVFFSLASGSQPQRQALLQFLAKHTQVAWCGMLLGDFQFGMAVYYRTQCELEQFLSALEDRFGVLFSHKAVSLRRRYRRYHRKYLAPAVAVSRKEFKLEPRNETAELDQVDRRILSEISSQGQASLREIARRLGLPFSTLERRHAGLLKRKVLQGYYLQIDTAMLGLVSYKLLLTLRGLGQGARERVLKTCQEHSRITYVIEALGDWDMEVGVEVAGRRDIAECLDVLYQAAGSDLVALRVLEEVQDLKERFFPF